MVQTSIWAHTGPMQVTTTQPVPTPATPTPTTSPLLALPAKWQPTQSATGFVRYARTLRATGQPCSAYRLAAATTPAQRKLAKHLRTLHPGAVFVLVHHSTGTTAGFTTWAQAYAYSCTWGGQPLAPSVVAQAGKHAASMPAPVALGATGQPATYTAPQGMGTGGPR